MNASSKAYASPRFSSDQRAPKCSHMVSILSEQVSALIGSLSAYEIARAKSAPSAVHTVYHIALDRAQQSGITILRQSLVNEKALAQQFALEIITMEVA